MPEAEDVLLEAAERATHVVRSVWERHRSAAERGDRTDTGAAGRRLAAWQTAWLGQSWPVAVADAGPAPGAVARWIRGLPPWTAESRRAPFTDGQRIWLPRAWLEPPGADPPAQRPLLATLGLARRLARSSVAAPPLASRLALDLWWLAEAALGDAAVARAWPGLAPALRSARRAELANRPRLDRLHGVEREVETWLRALLASPPEAHPDGLPGGLDPESDPAAIAAFASRRATALEGGTERYRGCAPVTLWGVHRTIAVERAEASTRRPAPRGPRPHRGARLPRPLLRRRPEPGACERSGPFVLPFSDPHLSVEDPGGLVRPPDRGHDEDLETLAEELARLEGLPVVRHDAPVRETLEDGGPSEAAVPWQPESLDAAGGIWLYPEWDVSREAYRYPGCRVRELPASGDDGAWAESTLSARRTLLARLHRQLDSLRPRRERLRRQPDGDDLDLCGWVDDWADGRAGRAPAGRVYSLDRPRRRDVAVALLLDTSGSTESWLHGRQRVIDVVKESALVFAEALRTLGDRFSLLSFSGQGAADVRIRMLKRFDESAGPVVQRRIGALEPDAFTRLGGAMRHATAGLARERSRARLLLVLSDGKPQDEDGYEGLHGIEDVRRAVGEARLQGIRVFGVTIDREGAAYLPRLFGPHGYAVIWKAEELPDRLPAVYRRLTA